MAEQQSEAKKGFFQFLLFIVMSLVAFALQMLIVQFGDDLLELCGVDSSRTFTAWIFGDYVLTAFIAFLVGNIVAKVVSYILNRKKTFAATNNLAFSFTVYVIMCVALIIVETLIGPPLANWYKGFLPEKIGEWSETFSMITYSIADFLIVFLMEKFVIMNNNLFASKNKSEVDEDTKIVEAVEPVGAEVEVAPVEEAAEVEEAPTKEEDEVEEIEEIAEIEEVAPAKEEAPAEVEEVAVVEEVQEEAAEEVEETPVPVEEAAAEEVEEAPAPAKEEVEEVAVEEVQEVDEEAPAKEEVVAPVKKARAAGKIEFELRLDGYHFSIRANNNQLMFESQGFASLDTAKSGLETFKKALTTGIATVYEDKNHAFRFIINKRYNGEGYKTRAQAEKAIESVKKFTENGTLVDYVEDPEKVKEYEASKKAMKKDTGVDWDKALAIPAKTSGKFTIDGHPERGFSFTLYANNGQLLFTSRYYASEESCNDAIITFKKAAYLGNFFIDGDKFGNYRFVLKGGSGVTYNGESYKTKESAQSSSESVKKFAKSAKIIPYSPEE